MAVGRDQKFFVVLCNDNTGRCTADFILLCTIVVCFNLLHGFTGNCNNRRHSVFYNFRDIGRNDPTAI